MDVLELGLHVMVGMIPAEANLISAMAQPTQHVRQTQDGILQVHVIQVTNVREVEQEQRHGLQEPVQQTAVTQIHELIRAPVVQIIPVRFNVQHL